MHTKTLGYIYIIFNNSYLHYGNNIFKIGKSICVKNRINNYTTCYVDPVEIKYTSEICIDYSLAEKNIFIKLQQYRVINNREFFNIDLHIAIETINKIVTEINSGVLVNNKTNLLVNNYTDLLVNNYIVSTTYNNIHDVKTILYGFIDDTELNQLLNISLNESPNDMANVLYYMYKNVFCYIDNIWNNSNKLKFFICNDLVKLYKPFNKITKVNQLINTLQTSAFIDSIIIQTMLLFNNCLQKLEEQIQKYLKYTKKELMMEYIITSKKFKCEKCKKHFPTKKNLIYHCAQNVCSKFIHIIRDNNKYKCSLCNTEYTHLRCLRYHLNNKKLNCNINNKKLNTNINNTNDTNINNKKLNTNDTNINNTNDTNMNNTNDTNINNTNDTNIKNTNDTNMNNTKQIIINHLIPLQDTTYDIDLIQMQECLANPHAAIEIIINNIHFNIKNSHNMNIINSNLRNNTIKVYNYNFQNELGWITQYKNIVYEFLYNKTVSTLSTIVEKLKINNINFDSQKEINLNIYIANLYHDKQSKKEIIQRINNITYDIHKIALINKKNNNFIK